MPSHARNRLTKAPVTAPAIGPAITEPVMLETIAATIAASKSFPSTAMLRKPLRSATIPARAPMPTGIAKLSVLLKNTVRFAVVPSRSEAIAAKRNSGEIKPMAIRQLKLAPRANCRKAVTSRETDSADQMSTTGTE